MGNAIPSIIAEGNKIIDEAKNVVVKVEDLIHTGDKLHLFQIN